MTRLGLYLAGAALIGAVVVGFTAYVYDLGRAAERVATLERSVQALRERRDTNARVHNLSDADLCRALGGLPDAASGECL